MEHQLSLETENVAPEMNNNCAVIECNCNEHPTSSIDSGIADHLAQLNQRVDEREDDERIHGNIFNKAAVGATDDYSTEEPLADSRHDENNVHRNLGHSLLGAASSYHCAHFALTGYVLRDGESSQDAYVKLACDLRDHATSGPRPCLPPTPVNNSPCSSVGETGTSPQANGRHQDSSDTSVCVVANIDDWWV